ncbi:methionine aminopeptidase [Ruminococcus sp. CAG:382]|jgi:methionine aminopeptidase, type I|nr:type I methionyl aminopeptidase [Ruminococcus sp.]MDD6300578.1 type I methionyl aminopeptidase [Ruminococcus sp.]CDD01785.1 methionine aminopeptidase [Ruminococcus sp. CAG:382]
MIIIKTDTEIQKMRDAGRITALARQLAGEHVREGVTTKFIDRKVKEFIVSHGAKPSFLGLYGFPASACISVNEEVIHGIPSDERVLKYGDIVSVDVGAFYKGYHGDCAATFVVGDTDDESKRLIEVTRQSFFEGIKFAVDGNRVGDISAAVQAYVEKNGFSVVRDFVGHGVGKDLHENPDVPNYGKPGRGPRLQTGMTIAVEPMVNAGTWRVKTLSNDWTVVTIDGKRSAHYENTIAITENGVEILTSPD